MTTINEARALAATLAPGDYILPTDGGAIYPSDALSVREADPHQGTADVCRQGGGFLIGPLFLGGFRKVTPEEIANPDHHAALFTLDGVPAYFEGITTGQRWNGWGCPLFTHDAAWLVLTAMGQCGYVWSYDQASDTFTGRHEEAPDDEEPETWTGVEVRGEVRYGIGYGCWCWNVEERPGD